VAQNGDIEMARELLSRGGDPDLTDDQGRTPRDVAVATGADDLIELFGDQGAVDPGAEQGQ
jgi:ankyrin repeat protein